MSREYFWVYVLLSKKDHLFYIGFTTNLKRRFHEHQQGKSKSTAPRRPFRLLFCEAYISKKDALRRERYFKTNPGKKTLKLMLKESLKEIVPDHPWRTMPSEPLVLNEMVVYIVWKSDSIIFNRIINFKIGYYDLVGKWN